ncbi:MAG: hypothetical protein JSS72_12890 [Armatimonadetes bacterium]|nr:hypothetical protein [Armatimonadota bacterium]
MTNLRIALLLTLLLGLIGGCGGGGSSGGGGGSLTFRAEATDANGNQIDPTNIVANSTAQFVIVGYDGNGNRTVIHPSGWSTSDISGAAGSLQGGGTFTAGASASAMYTASITYGANVYAVNYEVQDPGAIITGNLIDVSTGLGIEQVRVDFYNSLGQKVGFSYSAFNGFFRGVVPTSAAFFTLDPSTIQLSQYYRSYGYLSKNYTALDNSCIPPVPGGLAIGVTAPLPGNVTLIPSSYPPPPPPSGCG